MRSILSILALFSLAAVAAPKVEKAEDGSLQVTTARYVGVISPTSGFLSTLKLADGDVILTGSRLYCDVLPDGRKNLRAKADEAPQIKAEADGAITVKTTGKLVDDDGALHPTYPFSYHVLYRFDDTREARVSVSLIPDFDNESVYGFAGHVFGISGEREFFANTADGLISQMAPTHGGRTYQSESEPLDHESPYLGVVRTDGQVVEFRLAAGLDSLLNVFFHDSSKGSTSLFFCPLSGRNSRRAKAGEAWRHDLVISATPLAEWLKRTPTPK
jgi:hypothetical protein